MGYRLQMSAEIYDWLAELRGSDPSAAALAAEALAVLAADGDRLGPPLVTAVAAPRPRPEALLPALDRHYQAQLESVNLIRRRVAQTAMQRKDLERQLTEPEPPPDPAGLRERLAAAIEAEEQLTAESQREQMRVDAFRTRKEVLKAAYWAARAVQLIEQAQEADEDAVPQDDPAGAAARLDEITGQIEQELDLEAPAEGLMELRPGARRQRHPHPVRRRAARHRAADRRAGGRRRRAGPLPRSRPPRLRGAAGGAVRSGPRGSRAHVRRHPVVPRGILPRLARQLCCPGGRAGGAAGVPRPWPRRQGTGRTGPRRRRAWRRSG